MNISPTKDIVINWHITEACNYSCQYCYAHWCKPKHRELIHDELQIKQLLTEIARYFSSDNKSNILNPHMRWKSIRMNIAGGEPLLYPKQVLSIAKSCSNLGLSTSIISNGSRLTHELIWDLAPYLTTLGLSIDSGINKTNVSIGRIESNENKLDTSKLLEIVNIARIINPKMKVKLNTVVNSQNFNEDMTGLIKQFEPDRWKVLQILPVVNSGLTITHKQFDCFVKKHQALSSIMSIEDNDAMIESYIMIDPLGRFFQNISGTSEEGYTYSSSILDIGADQALREVKFSTDNYITRYSKVAA